MIVDLKKVSLGRSLDDGTLWVIEQIPGFVVGDDQTAILRAGQYSFTTRRYVSAGISCRLRCRRVCVCLFRVSVCCVTFAESEPYCRSILFFLSVGHSATYNLPRLIDHNQLWSAGIYLSSDPCKPFWIPCLPHFRCQREKYATFRL